MFDVAEVELVDFGPYHGLHIFNFPIEPGLYCLTGRNLVYPRLGANGVGKSKLLDAIYWCLYGKTTRGLKGNDVVTWQKKSCSVTTYLVIDKQRISVCRTQNPNSLILTVDDETKAVEQDELQKVLRLNAQAFTYAVMMPQFGECFFDLKPTDKLGVFSQIMDLDFWLEKSKSAEVFANILEKNITKLEAEVETATNNFDQAQADLASMEEKAIAFGKEQKQKIADLKLAKTEIEDELSEVTAKLKKLGQVTLKDYSSLLKSAKTNEKTCNENVGRLEAKLDQAKGSLDKLRDLGSTCKVCRQPISTKHTAQERAKLLAEIEELKSLISSEKIAAASASVKVANLLKAEKENENAFAHYNNTVKYSKHWLAELTKAQETIDKERDRTNPYQELADEKLLLCNSLSEKKTKLAGQAEDARVQREAVAYWVNGFKRIRLFVIEDALGQLELEVNSNLAALGLTDWRIEFDVERENKSGGVTKGFVVLVRSPDNADPVRWEAWSGGETQRLRLAGDLGLANLIMESAGLKNAIEFFDEPSQHMSDEGILDLAEQLHDRAVSNAKKIWLIEHRAVDFGDFQDTVVVTKDKNGSCFTHI